MTRYLNQILLSVFILVSPAYGMDAAASSIIHIHDLAEIIEHTTPGSVAFFDLDNTCIVACKLNDQYSVLGTDQMVSHMFVEATKVHGDINAAIESVLPTYYALQHTHECVLTQPDVTEILNALKEVCIVQGLTARSKPLKDRTVAQLDPLGICFKHECAPQEPIEITLRHSGVYAHGIGFAGSNDKGEFALEMLKHMQAQPRKIIMIDDKEKNLKAVAQAAQKAGVEFVGFLYRRCDADVAHFATQADAHVESWRTFELDNQALIAQFRK